MKLHEEFDPVRNQELFKWRCEMQKLNVMLTPLVVIAPTQTGVDLIRDTGGSETAYKDWYYGQLNIADFALHERWGDLLGREKCEAANDAEGRMRA